jgi:hypothetical protein
VVAASSFCLKPKGEDSLSAARVRICDGCVVQFADVIRGKPSALPTLAPWEPTSHEVLPTPAHGSRASHEDEVFVALPLVAAARAQGEENVIRWLHVPGPGVRRGPPRAARRDAPGLTHSGPLGGPLGGR